jgi:hypothetical protein
MKGDIVFCSFSLHSFEATVLKRDSVLKLGVLATLNNWFIEGFFGDAMVP